MNRLKAPPPLLVLAASVVVGVGEDEVGGVLVLLLLPLSCVDGLEEGLAGTGEFAVAASVIRKETVALDVPPDLLVSWYTSASEPV